MATILSLALLLTTTTASAAKRIALLIGNQDYKPGVGRLVNPLNDVGIIRDALRKVGFKVLEPVKNATRIEMLDALERYTARLKEAGTDALGFLYYSGHGIASRGTNYLVPIDVERPSSRLLRAYGLKQSEVLALLRKDAPNAAHYFVIDACRNEMMGAKGSKGFVAIHQQPGALIAFATAPGQTASDLGAESGPYAQALAIEIVKPGITDLQMFSNVRYRVASASGGDQVPWTLDGILRRNRVMFGGAKSSAPQPPLSEAAHVWSMIKESKDRSVLQTFIGQYSHTVQAQLARQRLEMIKAAQVAALPVPLSSTVQSQSLVPLPREILARKVQAELKRLGCYSGPIDGDWGPGSRKAIERFNTAKALSLSVAAPTQDIYRALRQSSAAVCAIAKLDPKAQGAADHDGYWRMDRFAAPMCSIRRQTVLLQVRGGKITGLHSGTGTISKDGAIRMTQHLTWKGQKFLRYFSGKVQGNSGRGTFRQSRWRCHGTIKLTKH